jgi:acylphosphatase
MIRTVKIQVSGRVQGVYFRKFTKLKAQKLGILGTVKNLDDGRVEIVAQSEEDLLEAFIQWCHRGPITARVDQVSLIELDSQSGKLDSFKII